MTHPTPQYRTRRIMHLDGRPWASAGFTGGGDVWGWVLETVAHELETSEESIGLLEDPDRGDLVTVDGIPAFILC